jgi:Zn-dependent protease with chaperone function
VAAPAAPERAPAAADRRASPGPLLGMYALLAVALGCVGVAAGQLLFVGDRSISAHFYDVENRCELRFPLTGRSATSLPGLDHCTAVVSRSEGLFLLGAAVVFLALTGALIFVVPWLDRWRLARVQHFTQIPGITPALTARFGALADLAGLTGHRRPELLVAGVRQAFTTARPGGRPLVVMPVRTALSAAGEPSRFDAVVLHELAHVRARDVSLVSAVRGIAWVTVPAVVLAAVPEVPHYGANRLDLTYLVQAAAFVVVTLLIAAGLLRRREVAADRQAARWLQAPEALEGLLAAGTVPSGTVPSGTVPSGTVPSGSAPAGVPSPGVRAWWRRATARHPSRPGRIAALRDPLGARDDRFAVALAVGAIAALAMSTAAALAGLLDETDAVVLEPRVWAAAGGVVLGLGLVPVLMHGAAQGRRAGLPFAWWQIAAGTGTGLLLGSLVPPATAGGAVLSVVLGAGVRSLLSVVALAVAGTGVSVLAGGLASLAAERFPRPPAGLTAGLTVAVGVWIAGVLLPVRDLAFGPASPRFAEFLLAGNPWRWLLVLYPVVVVALAARFPAARRPGAAVDMSEGGPGQRSGSTRRRPAAVLAPLGTSACAAVVAAVIFLACYHVDRAATPAELERWTLECSWVGALAGWVVLLAGVLTGRMAGLARAGVAAWLATLLVGTACAAAEAVGWRLPFSLLLPQVTLAPGIWLLYLALPTSLLALRASQPGALTRARATRAWVRPAAACAGAAAAAVVVFSTGIPSLVGPQVATAAPPAHATDCGSPASGPAASRPAAAGTAGQVLTNAAAGQALAGVCPALPAGWAIHGAIATGVLPNTALSTEGHIRPAACGPFTADQYLSIASDPVAGAAAQYDLAGRSSPGQVTMTAYVVSFARAVPAARLFAAVGGYVTRCRRYAVIAPGGSLAWTAHGLRIAGTGVPARAYYLTTSTGSGTGLVGQSVTRAVAVAGHNLVLISQVTAVGGFRPAPGTAVVAAALAAAADGLRKV